MRLLQLVRGGLVPHAPLLLPELWSDETRDSATAIGNAMHKLSPDDVDVAVIVSPHGARTGVYQEVAGSLGAFGFEGIEGGWSTMEGLGSELARAWGASVLDGPVDHGILVPLLLLGDVKVPVVAASFNESEDGDELEAGADSLVSAIRKVTGSTSALFVASANDSAGLTPRAPLTELEGATEMRSQYLAALTEDIGQIEPLARRLSARGGSCGLGPLLCLARLFSGRGAEILAAAQPVGVGYTVASIA